MNLKWYKDKMEAIEFLHDDLMKKQDKLIDDFRKEREKIYEKLARKHMEEVFRDSCKHGGDVYLDRNFDWRGYCSICGEMVWHGQPNLKVLGKTWADSKQIGLMNEFRSQLYKIYEAPSPLCQEPGYD